LSEKVAALKQGETRLRGGSKGSPEANGKKKSEGGAKTSSAKCWGKEKGGNQKRV